MKYYTRLVVMRYLFSLMNDYNKFEATLFPIYFIFQTFGLEIPRVPIF